jgi:hypothetical protein
MAIGLIHCIIGVLMTWGILVDWHACGWWHSIENRQGMHMQRFACLWFQVSSVSWVMMGWLMQQWLNRFYRLPPKFGWALFTMGLLVAFVLPASGAWLFLPLGLMVAWHPRRVTTQ